jgi:alkanesulfonate monooxygenase SsuD/methylene tetrahydromethanopterin reductase-like flavin-dependent oxidoreductase (luciferase family)
MKAGVILPFGDARIAADVAREAEDAGWDGFFVFEPVWGWDAWVSLAAAAMVTERIRLGTMLSPLSRMRPWKVASETVSLDHLSNGRTILSVGLGAVDTGFEAFGEETDRRVRAELMNEALDIVTGLWSGEPFSYQGAHYRIQPSEFMPPPPPLQRPRIPIWVVGAWPRERSMRRVMRYDGLLPNVFDEQGKPRLLTPDDVRAMRDYANERHPDPARFDIVIEGETPGDDGEKAADEVGPLAEAGMTWWLEASWAAKPTAEHLRKFRERVRQGPPAP